MAKHPNQLPRELKQLEAKEIDPSLLYIRKLRGKIKEESNLPPIMQLPGPNHKWSIPNSPTTINNTFHHPSATPEVISLTSAQSSSELDTDQGDMLDKTIKQVTHKLHETILTLDIGTFYPDRVRSAHPNKPMTTPSVTVNPW